jgi:serine/threonine protein kinase
MTASAASVEAPLPRTIGRYTLFDKIGRGGMADIFLARVKTELGVSRLVVIKQILPHLADSKEFSDLLITEAKLAARLDHANIVQVNDLGRADGFLYIAMQYVEGFDLNDLLKRCTRTKTALPVQYALFVVIEALRALDYAHRKMADDGSPLGIVHRDVSPSNLLISFEGEVKLCDFGIAHANDVVTQDTFSEDVIKGKAGYMSPEQANGGPLDARADVFAIGIVVWELLAGKRLYKMASDMPSLLDQAKVAMVPDLPSRSLPNEERLFAIVKKALAPNRDARYPTAAAFLYDLEHYVAESKLMASPLKFGEWLIDRFGDDLIHQRRERERAVQLLEAGARADVVAEMGPPPSSARHHSDDMAAAAPSDEQSASRPVSERAAGTAGRPAFESIDIDVSQVASPVAEKSTAGMWLAFAAVLVVVGSAVYFLTMR